MQFQSDATLQGAVMTFGVLDTHDHDEARAVDVASGFGAWWGGFLAAQVSHHWSLIGINCLDQASSTGPSVEYLFGLPSAGTASGDAAGGQVAAITTLLTAFRGRANRGRSYMVGVPAASINDSDGTALDPAPKAAIQAAYTNINSAIGGVASGAVHAILSRSQALALPVGAYDTRAYLGTQRRRVNGA